MQDICHVTPIKRSLNTLRGHNPQVENDGDASAPLVPYSILDPCGSTDCSLVIIELVAKTSK